MKITLLDTKTGNTSTFESGFSPGYWASGNGCCDCNRAPRMDDDMACDDELDKEMREAHPGIEEWQSYCYGKRRILIVEADCAGYSLEELNAGYPDGLVERHILAKGWGQAAVLESRNGEGHDGIR